MAGISNPKIHRATLMVTLLALLALNTVKAQAQNIEPIADAGSSRYAGPNPIILDGTASYDPDRSGPLSYTWQQVSGPSVVIIDKNSATPTIAGSIQPDPGRDPTPKPQGFTQTDAIQECEFELVVSDGELTSLPDTVRVIIVPDFGYRTSQQENPPFDADKPTIIYFGGGNCVTGSGSWGDADWAEKANIISCPNYGPDSDGGARTYYKYGDVIIVYLSAVAAEYKQSIQTIGFSTGGDPAMDVGIHLNRVYSDARYAVNHVTELDAGCRWNESRDLYFDTAELFWTSAVDGDSCWVEFYYGVPYYLPLRDTLAVCLFGLSHGEVLRWYKNSLTGKDMNTFNNGLVAGAYWSVIGPGKNLQLAPTDAYHFRWDGNVQGGGMSIFDEALHPGRLPEPVTLVEPVYTEDHNGVILSCEESENAVGYELLFGMDPYRVMDYEIISDTPAPPNEIITPPDSDGFWWTVRVRDQFGSTIHADPEYLSLNDPNDTVEVNEANDGGQVDLERDQILVVTLESNPSTGYRWEQADNNVSILEQFGEAEFKPSDTGDPPLVGAGGWEIFRFKAVSTGQMILNLVYGRPWEDVDPLKTFSIEVIVH